MNKELRISNILKDLGVAPNLKGYHYLKYAIEKVSDDFTIVNNVTKIMYPLVAEAFDTTPQRVERAMHHAIETGWAVADYDLMCTMFGNTVKSKKVAPTNSQYVATIVDYMNMTQEE